MIKPKTHIFFNQNVSVNTQKKKHIYIDRIDDSVFAADFLLGNDTVFAADFCIGSEAVFAADFLIGSDAIFAADFCIGSDAVFAADFCIGSDVVFVLKKIINLRSWEGGVKSVLDRPKQGQEHI